MELQKQRKAMARIGKMMLQDQKQRPVENFDVFETILSVANLHSVNIVHDIAFEHAIQVATA